MIVLGLDTALDWISVAVARLPEETVVLREEWRPRGHAERLFPLLRETLAEAGLALAQIDRFAVTVGPGSFTGTRIGLATARGLALAADRPLIGVTTFDTLAEALSTETGVLALAFPAPRGEIFLELRKGGEPLGPPAALGPQMAALRLAALAEDFAIAGSGGDALAMALQARGIYARRIIHPPVGHAGHVARLASRRVPPEEPPSPLYLREADATPAATT